MLLHLVGYKVRVTANLWIRERSNHCMLPQQACENENMTFDACIGAVLYQRWLKVIPDANSAGELLFDVIKMLQARLLRLREIKMETDGFIHFVYIERVCTLKRKV